MSDSQVEILVELFEENQSLRQHNKDDIVQTLNTAGGPEMTRDTVQKVERRAEKAAQASWRQKEEGGLPRSSMLDRPRAHTKDNGSLRNVYFRVYCKEVKKFFFLPSVCIKMILIIFFAFSNCLPQFQS